VDARAFTLFGLQIRLWSVAALRKNRKNRRNSMRSDDPAIVFPAWSAASTRFSGTARFSSEENDA
jgi:hypothetical protein